MATRALGQLTLDLVARIGGFTGPLEKASRSAKRDMKRIAGSVKTATTAITAAGAAATAAAAGVIAFTNNAAQNAKEMQRQAQLANTSAEEFQRLAYASNTVGLEQDKLSDILKDVNDRVGDFLTTGGGEMADFFEKIAPRIGMTADEFRNLSGPQALQKFYDGLEKANLSQAEMVFYMESMANDATALIPLLRDGGAGFAEMADEADRLGIVLSELEIARLEEFAGQFDRLASIFGSMSNILASELAPYMSVLADELVEAAGGADGLRSALPGAIRSSVEAIGPLLNGLHMARIAIEGLQAASGTVAQGYSFAFLTIQENATKMLDFVAGGINEIIEGFNNLPGIEIPLIDSFNRSGYMESLREGYAEVAEFAQEQRDQVVDLWNAPMPSDTIDDYLDSVDEKVAEFREKFKDDGGLFGTTGAMGAGMSSPGVEDQTGPATFWLDEAKLEEQLGYWEQWLEGASEAVKSFDELAGNTIENFSRRFGDAFEDMIFDSKSLGDAIYDLADGMLRSVVSALGEMAAQWVAYQAVQAMVGQTAQTTAATTAAATGSAIASAYAPAAAMASLASFGANAAPAMAGISATSAMAQSMSLMGMAHEGIDNVPTEGTWLLDKGERVMRAPQADKLDQFLAQQQSGGGSGPAPTVNIVEDKSRAGTTSQRQDRDGAWIVDVVVADIMGDGRIDKAQRSKYGLTPQGR